MVIERHDDPEDTSNVGRRSEHDRDKGVTGAYRGEVRQAFLQIGVDIYSSRSIDEFRSAIEWAKEARREQERRQSVRRQIMVGGLLAALGGIISAFIGWLVSHTPKAGF